MNARLFLQVVFAIGLGGSAAPVLAGRVSDPPPPVSIGTTPAMPKLPEEAPVWTAPATPPAGPTAAGSPRRTMAELEKLVAPIALHPDPLIASILAAATYPLEIVQAAQFVAQTNNRSPIDAQPWDVHVRTIAKIPPVLEMMNRDLLWTAQLGQSFVEQPMDVMQAIQDRRAQAQVFGHLKTTPQQAVTTTNAIVERTYEGQIIYVTNSIIQVQPASPEVIHVPSYDPAVVYAESDVVAASFISFGVGIAFGAAFWGHCDWNYGGCYWGGCAPAAPACPPAYYNSAGTTAVKPGGRPFNQAPIPARPVSVASPQAAISRPAGVQAGATATSTPQRWQPDPVRYGGGKPTPSTGQSPNPTKISSPKSLAPSPSSFNAPRPTQFASVGVKAAPQPVAAAGRPVSIQPSSITSGAGTSSFRSPSVSRAPAFSSSPSIQGAGGLGRSVSQGASGFKGVSSSVGRSLGNAGSSVSRGASSVSRGIGRMR